MSDESHSVPVRVKDWFSPGRFAFILAVMVFVPFRDVLLGTRCFAVRDFGLFSYPVAAYFRDSFWRGELPLWNPLSCCGTPFLAQLNTLTLYPPSLIYLLLPLTWSLPFFCLFHLFLGGVGMYFLAARWSGSWLGGAVAGTIFAFNGLSLNFLMWPSHMATFALAPWVIWLTEEAWQAGGRKMILAALMAAFQVLAGGPETILLTWLILLAPAAISFQRRTVRRTVLARRFLTVGCVALCLAAAQLLPFADFSLHSNRSNGFGNSDWSMPARGWANFLVPLFETSKWQQIAMQSGQYWTSSYYAGIGAVFLAVMAVCRRGGRRVWLLSAILVLSLILALGGNGFLFKPLQRLFPFLGLFRYPVKFVLATLCAIPLLAAFAIGHYQKRGPDGSWRREWACGGTMLALMAFITAFARYYPAGDTSWGEVAVNGLERAFFLVLTIGLVYLLATRPAWGGGIGLVLLTACWLDVLSHTPWQNPTVDPSIYQPGLALLKVHFKPRPVVAGESRVMMSPFAARQLYYKPSEEVTAGYLLDRVVFMANCNLLDGVPKVDGFFSLYLRDIDKVLSLFDTHTARQLAGLEDVMAVSQTIAPGEVFDWVSRPSYVPWVSAGQAPVFAGDGVILAALGDTNNDFRKIIYLPPEARASVTAGREESARIVAQQFGPERIVVDVRTPGPTMVSISQAWYHDWKAYVDGKSVPLWRANVAFQAVEVPGGEHQVKLVYEDLQFRNGAAISVFALLICVGSWIWLGRDRGGKEEPKRDKGFF